MWLWFGVTGFCEQVFWANGYTAPADGINASAFEMKQCSKTMPYACGRKHRRTSSTLHCTRRNPTWMHHTLVEVTLAVSLAGGSHKSHVHDHEDCVGCLRNEISEHEEAQVPEKWPTPPQQCDVAGPLDPFLKTFDRWTTRKNDFVGASV